MRFKKLLITLSAINILWFCSNAFAADYVVSDSGFSLGAQAGYGKLDYGNQNNSVNNNFLPITSNQSAGGIAGRLYASYQFNPYSGLEVGYSIFSNNPSYDSKNAAGDYVNIDIQTQTADLLLKLGTPFGDSGFRGDIKGGIAYVISDDNIDNAFPSLKIAHSSTSVNHNKTEPEGGASISYNFTQNFAADISYIRIFGHDTHDSPNISLSTLGISYHF